MSKYKWLLDAGHGGFVNGHYVTAPKKMHKFSDGFTIYEGVINRQICNKLVKLIEGKYDHRLIHSEVDDLSLQVRVSRADNEFTKDSRCIFLSIHSNAGGGKGFEIFTSKGQTKSDKIAQIFCEVYKKKFPENKFRNDLVDGDDDKEAEFYVLRKTDCPAVLVENLFFDNRQDAEFLMSEVGQNRIADCLFECIEATEKLKPI
jgi:N-acetylmuramoyl-L-alanine amidase